MFSEIYKKLQTKEGITLVASIALIVGMLGFVFGSWGHHDMSFGQQKPTITVTGKGEVVASPDIAKISFSVEKTEKTMAAAQNATSELANNVTKQLVLAGVAEKDIRTEGFNAYPKYENKPASMAPCSPTYCPPSDTNPVISGYTVSTSYSVKVRSLDKVSDILKLITDANVTSVYGPDFMIDDADALANQARDKAIADAKEQARILAKQLGVQLKGIVDFQVMNGNYPMMLSARAADAPYAGSEKSFAPDIKPGETTTNVQVSVTYRIDD